VGKKSIGSIVILILLFGNAHWGLCATYKSEYKMSTVVGPTGPWGEGASRFAEAVKKATEGA
jgi:TRAP-type transport system periplasmic protein